MAIGGPWWEMKVYVCLKCKLSVNIDSEKGKSVKVSKR